MRKYSEVQILKRLPKSTGYPISHFAQLSIIFNNNKIDRGTTFRQEEAFSTLKGYAVSCHRFLLNSMAIVGFETAMIVLWLVVVVSHGAAL